MTHVDEDCVSCLPETQVKRPRRNERRKIKNRATIVEILHYLETEADILYQGDVENNMLKLFNQLTVDDKRTFLRHSITALWEKRIEVAKRGILPEKPVVVDTTLTIEPEVIKSEVEELESSKEKDLDSFSLFIGRVILVMFLVFGTFIMFWSLFYSMPPEGEKMMGYLGEILKILVPVW